MKNKFINNINFKIYIYVFIFCIYFMMFMFDIFKCSYVYFFPLFFEICILLLKKIKYKNIIVFKKLDIIKDIILFIPLIVEMTNVNLLENVIIIKILLTFTIVTEILLFVRYNSLK